MSYLQFSLLHIPAVIVHGNSLSLDEFDRWYTPAHILDGWTWKLRRQSDHAHSLQTMPEPERRPEPKPERPHVGEPPAPPSQLTQF